MESLRAYVKWDLGRCCWLSVKALLCCWSFRVCKMDFKIFVVICGCCHIKKHMRWGSKACSCPAPLPMTVLFAFALVKLCIRHGGFCFVKRCVHCWMGGDNWIPGVNVLTESNAFQCSDCLHHCFVASAHTWHPRKKNVVSCNKNLVESSPL